MKDWEEKFEPHILARGEDYYERGLVGEIVETDRGYKATVHGTEDYTVEIDTDGDYVSHMHCDCPYAEGGENCKHMAAVLIAIDIEEGVDNIIDFDIEKAKRQDEFIHDEISGFDMDEMIRNAERDELELFLISEMESDPEMARRFRIFMTDIVSASELDSYKEQLNDTFSAYTDRYNFISYYMARELETDLYDFIKEKIIDTFVRFGKYDEAFMLTAYLLEKLEAADIDDSDGITVDITGYGADIIQGIIDNGSEILKKRIFDWMSGLLERDGENYLSDIMVDIWRSSFCETVYMERKRNIIMNKLDEYSGGADEPDDYRLSFWCDEYFALAEEMKLPEDEITSVERKCWHLPSVRKRVTDRCISKGKFEDAIEILKQSREMDTDYYGLVIEYTRRLAELYHVIGNEEKCRQELFDLIVRLGPLRVEDFRRLKKCYTDEEWPSIREKVFKKIKGKFGVEDLYLEEKMYDRVLASMKSNPTPHLVERYAYILSDVYPEDTVMIYGDMIKKKAEFTGGRKYYREIVKLLKKLERFPGGKDAVKNITEEFRELYKRRTAMMEELDRL